MRDVRSRGLPARKDHVDESIRRALARGHTIDITTVGRRTGRLRRVELVFHAIDGRIYLSGMAGGARPRRARRPARRGVPPHLPPHSPPPPPPPAPPAR